MADATPSTPRPGSIMYALGRLSADSEAMKITMDAMPGVITAALVPIGTRLSDHEDRIRVLERSHWKVAGIGSVIGFLGSMAVVSINLSPWAKHAG